jgi:hypothetical protein
MQPVPTGTRIRVLSNQFNHSYTIGCVYTVTHIDDDGTFKAADDKGRIGNWLRWSECEPAAPSIWSRVAADLPEPLVRFLACFDGIADITLKEKVIDAVLAKLTDLPERIVAAAATPLGENATAANQPQQPSQQSSQQ